MSWSFKNPFFFVFSIQVSNTVPFNLAIWPGETPGELIGNDRSLVRAPDFFWGQERQEGAIK